MISRTLLLWVAVPGMFVAALWSARASVRRRRAGPRPAPSAAPVPGPDPAVHKAAIGCGGFGLVVFGLISIAAFTDTWP